MAAEIKDIPTAELEKELARRREEEKRARELAWEARKVFLLMNINALLLLTPEHGRTSCSDEVAVNVGRCNRCTFLAAKDTNSWDNYRDVRIEVIGHDF